MRQLTSEGTYAEAQESQFFPGIRLSGMLPFLKADSEKDYLTRIREFREWVRDQLRRRGPNAAENSTPE